MQSMCMQIGGVEAVRNIVIRTVGTPEEIGREVIVDKSMERISGKHTHRRAHGIPVVGSQPGCIGLAGRGIVRMDQRVPDVQIEFHLFTGPRFRQVGRIVERPRHRRRRLRPNLRGGKRK